MSMCASINCVGLSAHAEMGEGASMGCPHAHTGTLLAMGSAAASEPGVTPHPLALIHASVAGQSSPALGTAARG